jgi:putative endonuclease
LERWLRPEAGQPWAGSGQNKLNIMYYVYVLKSKINGRLYKGFTRDLKKRLRDHNSGRAEFTKKNKPWELVYYEAFISEKSARQEEIFLKSGKGKQRLKYILEN